MANVITRRKFLRDSALAAGALVTASGLLVPRSAYAADTPGTAPPTYFFKGASDSPDDVNKRLTDVTYNPNNILIHRQVSVDDTLLPNYTGTIYHSLQDAVADWDPSLLWTQGKNLVLHIAPKDGGWSGGMVLPPDSGPLTRVILVGHGENAIPNGLDASGNIPNPDLTNRVVFTERTDLLNDCAVWNIVGRQGSDTWPSGRAPPLLNIQGNNNYIGFSYGLYEFNHDSDNNLLINFRQEADIGNLFEGCNFKIADADPFSNGIQIYRKSTPETYTGKIFARNCVIQGNNLATRMQSVGSVDFGSTEYPGENIFTNTPLYLDLVQPPPVRPSPSPGESGTSSASGDLIPQFITFYNVNQFQNGTVPFTNVDDVLNRIIIRTAGGAPMTALELKNQQSAAMAKGGYGTNAAPPAGYEEYLKVGSIIQNAQFPNRNERAVTAVRNFDRYSKAKDLEERAGWQTARAQEGTSSRRDFFSMFNPGYSGRSGKA